VGRGSWEWACSLRGVGPQPVGSMPAARGEAGQDWPASPGCASSDWWERVGEKLLREVTARVILIT